MAIDILKTLSFVIIAYIGYQIYINEAQKNYNLTSQTQHSQQQLQNENAHHKGFYHDYNDKILLSEYEETELIRKYGEKEHSIKSTEDCAIGVGYTTCMDIGFSAVELINKLKVDLEELSINGEITPKVHEQIFSLRSFIETFLYYFSKGANAERSTDSSELFKYLLENIQTDNPIKYNPEIGGHSSVWAIRAQRENCKAFIAAQASDFNHKALHYTPEHSEKYLQWPHQSIQAESKQQHGDIEEPLDIHLVFEYKEGDEILGYKAPRSNRFYFVDDPNGASLKQMETYHKLVKDHPHIKRHLFGGYQLMQKLEYQEVKERLEKQEQLWNEMRQTEPGHMIHVEFAHFSNLEFFKLFDKHVVRQADSLGMNEQELVLILELWQNKLKDINQARDSKPTIEFILEQLRKFFILAKEQQLPLSRVHLHPYGSFLMCYDRSKWEDAHDAIIKSSMATPKFCKMTDKLEEEHIDNYDVPERPKYIVNPYNQQDLIPISRDNLTYQFDLNDDITCYMQFFLKCRTLIKTAGLGDTISSTGFIYHEPKRSE